MIYKRYGTSYQSVDPDFDAKALNEITFRRNRQDSIAQADVDGFEVVRSIELAEEATGPVQSETEQAMLDKLLARIEEIVVALGEGEIVVLENEPGHDYPKPRQQTKNIVEHGENRLHFDYTMAPALRLSVRRRSG